ncbi:hypothetical protein HZH66_009709 [Vespula vulgaris]|uniref:Uncharacterized protein n=1 Tax=Vespula vulgaris TaxID=7454 RepID=A0A834JQU8_VESVU|nr:hypothetical protein HZH66_009709 [Vespula vulgaris]
MHPEFGPIPKSDPKRRARYASAIIVTRALGPLFCVFSIVLARVPYADLSSKKKKKKRKKEREEEEEEEEEEEAKAEEEEEEEAEEGYREIKENEMEYRGLALGGELTNYLDEFECYLVKEKLVAVDIAGTYFIAWRNSSVSLAIAVVAVACATGTIATIAAVADDDEDDDDDDGDECSSSLVKIIIVKVDIVSSKFYRKNGRIRFKEKLELDSKTMAKSYDESQRRPEK